MARRRALAPLRPAARPITEYPFEEELPKEIQEAIKDRDTDYPAYQYGLSIASGCKIGGGMSWNVTSRGRLLTACARTRPGTRHLDTGPIRRLGEPAEHEASPRRAVRCSTA